MHWYQWPGNHFVQREFKCTRFVGLFHYKYILLLMPICEALSVESEFIKHCCATYLYTVYRDKLSVILKVYKIFNSFSYLLPIKYLSKNESLNMSCQCGIKIILLWYWWRIIIFLVVAPRPLIQTTSTGQKADTPHEVVEGHPVVFNCEMYAVPSPNVSWFKNEVPFFTDTMETTSQILRCVLWCCDIKINIANDVPDQKFLEFLNFSIRYLFAVYHFFLLDLWRLLVIQEHINVWSLMKQARLQGGFI